jgi:type II secretory pathway pseudopilin PulG
MEETPAMTAPARTHRTPAEAGFTLVETVVMLTVAFILSGALVPIVSESVDTARAVNAANDAKLIAAGMIQFERDLGTSAIAYAGAGFRDRVTGGGTAAVPGVLISDGDTPDVADTDATDGPDYRKRFALNRPAALRFGRAARRAWLTASTGSISDHLVTNRAGYRAHSAGDDGGWNGPYISQLIKSDPWGRRYQINTGWLNAETSVADAQGNLRRAVFIVSAGPNGVIDTPFDQPISDATLMGDDVGIRIQ